ncbi:MAG: ATP-binding cassette domain-containing protein [Deltaproteobacteria bacterium]|nr:ATP-binding cassette domain-containing protein [Deltaproteobacteria bacterium]
MSSVLIAEKLTRCFNNLCAVDHIDFAVQKGHCFGFLGPNGAGKTTTIKMIYGALTPTSGSITLFGLPTMKNWREVKKRLGVVTQKDILEETVSCWDNLRMQGRHYGFDEKFIRERGEYLLNLLQLSSRANDPVYQFSGGMKRRLSIAKGLLNEPELLLLDEPTTGLDPQARLLMWKTLEDIKSKGTSILLTTHYMHEAETLCDDLVIIDHGKIIARGAPKLLIEKQGRKNLEEVFLELTGRDLRNE